MMEEQSTMTATTSLVAPTAPRRSNAEALDIAHMIVDAASDKKAQDILLLDVSEVAGFTDYFVICSGTSERQIRAVADGIDEALAERGVEPYKREGTPADGWVLLDYSDVVVHIFAPEQRAFYSLEKLWERGRVVARLV
jgi:ribosome-associated protein